MESYPPNSHRSKEPVSKEPKNIEKVTTTPVITRKKPLGRRFMETVFGGDVRSVLIYVGRDVLLPAAKDMITEAGSQALERLVFGETRGGGRRPGFRPSGSNGYVSYNRYSSSNRDSRHQREEREYRRPRDIHNLDEIILGTRAEAEIVLDRLYELLEKYGQVTVGDLKDLVGMNWDPAEENYGWISLKGAQPVRVRSGGYLLSLPRIESMD